MSLDTLIKRLESLSVIFEEEGNIPDEMICNIFIKTLKRDPVAGIEKLRIWGPRLRFSPKEIECIGSNFQGRLILSFPKKQ